jgi:hypothetical protein
LKIFRLKNGSNVNSHTWLCTPKFIDWTPWSPWTNCHVDCSLILAPNCNSINSRIFFDFLP